LVSYEYWETQVADVKGKYERGELVPDPEWQRGYIWTLKDEQLLIDSIMRNIPIPKFYLTQEYDKKKGVSIHYAVDGQQRLKAIYRFLTNKFPIGIDGKTFYFKELDGKRQQQITTYKLNGHYMTDYKQADITFLFRRLNSTGIKLTNMEVWNSEYYKTKILEMIREIYEEIWGFPHKRDYRDYDDSDYEKLKNSYVEPIYTEENIKRMLPLDDIVDLSNCLMKKSVESGSKNELASFLELKVDISSKDSSMLKSRFRKVLNNIKEIFSRQELDESLFSKRTHFISFFLAVGLLIPKYYILSDPLKLKEDLLEFIEDQPEEYKESVLGGIRQKAMRENRVKFLQKVIKKYAIKLDDHRFFDEDLKKEFWSKYPHQCQICTKEIHSFKDATLDHKTPWAKGGKTIKNNAQLAHKKCNQTKRDKHEEFVIT